jgi:hypothetical protein
MAQFGPQLIGETEKALHALLLRALQGSDLSESHWVSLRLAQQTDADLVGTIERRARFANATQLVAELTDRGLLAGDRPTLAGTDMLVSMQERIVALTAPVWTDLSAEDAAAAARVLETVLSRARNVLDQAAA